MIALRYLALQVSFRLTIAFEFLIAPAAGGHKSDTVLDHDIDDPPPASGDGAVFAYGLENIEYKIRAIRKYPFPVPLQRNSISIDMMYPAIMIKARLPLLQDAGFDMLPLQIAIRERYFRLTYSRK